MLKPCFGFTMKHRRRFTEIASASQCKGDAFTLIKQRLYTDKPTPLHWNAELPVF